MFDFLKSVLGEEQADKSPEQIRFEKNKTVLKADIHSLKKAYDNLSNQYAGPGFMNFFVPYYGCTATYQPQKKPMSYRVKLSEIETRLQRAQRKLKQLEIEHAGVPRGNFSIQ